MRRRDLLGIGLILAVTTSLCGIPFASQDIMSMDPVTGASKFQRKTFGIPHPASICLTPLDKRLEKMGIQRQNQWTFLTEKWLGGRACGSAPKIYQLGNSHDLMQAFVDHSSGDEIRTFVATMMSSSEAAQDAAVQAALDKGFAYAYPSIP